MLKEINGDFYILSDRDVSDYFEIINKSALLKKIYELSKVIYGDKRLSAHAGFTLEEVKERAESIADTLNELELDEITEEIEGLTNTHQLSESERLGEYYDKLINELGLSEVSYLDFMYSEPDDEVFCYFTYDLPADELAPLNDFMSSIEQKKVDYSHFPIISETYLEDGRKLVDGKCLDALRRIYLSEFDKCNVLEDLYKLNKDNIELELDVASLDKKLLKLEELITDLEYLNISTEGFLKDESIKKVDSKLNELKTSLKAINDKISLKKSLMDINKETGNKLIGLLSSRVEFNRSTVAFNKSRSLGEFKLFMLNEYFNDKFVEWLLDNEYFK